MIKYCIKENVPYMQFDDFSCIQTQVQNVLSGRKSVADLAENR